MRWPKPPMQANGAAAPAGRTPSDDRIGEPKPDWQARMPPRRTWLTFLVILLVNYLVVRLLFPGPDTPLTVRYTAFKEEVAKGNVESIYSQGASIEGRFAAPVTWPRPSDDKRGVKS